LAALLQVLQVEPKNLLALRAGSNLYLKNGLHTKALPLLETLVTVDAGSPDAHADLAAVYAASGNRDGAEKEFRRALELRPGYFPALAGLGNLLARGGDDAAALPLLRKAVEAQPGAYEGHFLLGSALNRQGLFAEAAMELEKAARSDAGSREPQVFYQLARALGGLNKAAERKDALVRFSELTKREKESTAQQREASALVDQARELVQAGNLEEAAKRLELAREARPGDGSLLFRLAGLHFDLGRFATAREYVQAAISISPATWLYHYLLGLVERADGRTTEARASLEVAAKLEPKEAPVWNTLGEVLLEQREAKAAAAAFQKAVELSPGDETYKRNLDAARRP
jgi:tetratricopeptide (TPR) repeat protein